jgi:exodeoxyribonuclease V alpha subunit
MLRVRESSGNNSEAAASPGPNFKTISGVIERITFQNEENGYTIARLLPDRPSDHQRKSTPGMARGEDKLVTVIGTLIGVVAGEALELTGFWQNHSMHGWQFKVENYRSVLPATTQGIRKYLGSGLIKGIGPKTAEKIVNHFDVDTLNILEHDPLRLIEVPKLGPHKVNLIAKAWQEQKAIKEVMLFLQGQGISTSLAVRIYKQYGDAAITIVKNEPYRLAREVWGIGFKTADKIAQSLGFTKDDPERVKAGTLFVLSEASDSGGHTYLPRQLLSEKAAELLEVSEEQVELAINELAKDEGVQLEMIEAEPEAEPDEAESATDSGDPWDSVYSSTGKADRSIRETALADQYRAELTEDEAATLPGMSLRKATPQTKKNPLNLAVPSEEQAVYLPPFYFAEQGITRQLLRLANCPPHQDKLADLKNVNVSAMFDYLANKGDKLELAERQREGVVMALNNAVAVLTGGPGTGKTTSMRALVRVLSLKKKKIVLAAPTGRAAKRLSEATGLEAKTLHRLLQLKPGSKPVYDQDSPIPADIIILDESSMLDTLMVNSLLKAIATGTHLLLVGDVDQLPSVGAGNVLSDIINSEVVAVTRLDHIFRQGPGSAINTNAHLINQGQIPVVGKDIKDFFFFSEEDPEKAGELVVDLVTRRIPGKFGFKPSDIQVLAPMHRGRVGVGYLNEQLQTAINPEAPGKLQKLYGGRVYRVGDKVLQLRNNYDKEVFNGDTGTITAINTEDQTATVNLEDGRVVEYDFSELDELTLAYAVSIHKSQGSEYPVCVIPIMMSHYMLLERKLIYTAVTRAKKLVVLVGSKRALAMAVRNGPTSSTSAKNQTGQTAKKAGNRPSADSRSRRYTGLLGKLRQSYFFAG